jgi:hypothetical protein
MPKPFQIRFLVAAWLVASGASAQDPAQKITITGLPSPTWDVAITPNKNVLKDNVIIGTIIRKSNNKWKLSYGYLAGESELTVTMASGKRAAVITVHSSKPNATTPVLQHAELTPSAENETVVISFTNLTTQETRQLEVMLDKPVVFFSLDLPAGAPGTAQGGSNSGEK